MFEIVKRQHIRPAGHLVPANQPRPAAVSAGYAWQAKYVFDRKVEDRSFFDDHVRPLCRGLADIDRESNQVS
jgi:hypothetical protein